MKKILIISKSKLISDPRVYKQIMYLISAGYYIITAGKTPSEIENEFYQMPFVLTESIWKDLSFKKIIFNFPRIFYLFKIAVFKKLRLYELFYWNTYTIKKTYKLLSVKIDDCDLIIANDIPAVPLALKLAKTWKSRVLVDAHEYEPLHFDDERFNSFYRDYWFYICKKYLPEADYMMTVCDGIAEEYSKNFNVECNVMMNLPFYENLEPVNRSDEKIKMVHHGAAQQGRKIESMIELMKHLDERFELYFMMLKMDTDYGQYLKKISKDNQRIHFVDPVEMPEIAKSINQYDIGLYLLKPDTFNQKMALPNKIFEFIQGRLIIAIWPSQEMVKIVDKYENGLYSENFNIKEMANILNNLSYDDIIKMKKNSHIAADELNSEKNRIHLLNIVKGLVKEG